jgi:hypothetical protein
MKRIALVLFIPALLAAPVGCRVSQTCCCHHCCVSHVVTPDEPVMEPEVPSVEPAQDMLQVPASSEGEFDALFDVDWGSARRSISDGGVDGEPGDDYHHELDVPPTPEADLEV